jgi:copper chaperone
MMKHISIHVENIKCGGCENSIRKEVLHQPGVQAVHIDGQQQIVHITGDDDMDVAHIAARLGRLGYPEIGYNSLVAKVKSYASCAVGRLTDEIGETKA